MSVTYFLEGGEDSDRRIALRDNAVQIGRHPDNDIVVRDDLASRYHCVIEPAGNGGGFLLRDLGSRNGTRVNDERVDSASLSDGDQIRVGSHEFRIVAVKKEKEKAGHKTRAGGGQTVDLKSIRKSGVGWVKALTDTIDALPGDAQIDEDDVRIVDARGQESKALSGGSPGAVAARLSLVLASRSRATDLHFEPRADKMILRIRVDGQMITIADLPKDVGDLVLGLFRTACHLRISGRDAIADGHFSAKLGAPRVDYRASFTPSVNGQKLVLRVLDLRHSPLSLDEIGLAPYMRDRLIQVCKQTQGMLLACGPTGSGKTTTLYNCMRTIDREAHNVITIEDPVEYSLEGVTQIPVDEEQGKDFNALLRSVLRQDPDVIFVGEIRDEETARTAMRAAMTGHLVFSTVHSKDTISAIFRLLDLGVEPFLVANSMQLVLAQRLVRTLCDNCKQEIRLPPGAATRMGRFAQGKTTVYAPVGCDRCLKTGFYGRQAVFEMLDFNDEMRDVVLDKPTITAMKKAIEGELFTTLLQSGWQLVARGETSLDEVERVVG